MDPIQLEIIRNALVAVAEEMSVTVWLVSRSRNPGLLHLRV
jgi:N-methylhydantoinase B